MIRTIIVNGEERNLEDLAFALRGEYWTDEVTFDDEVVGGDTSQLPLIVNMYDCIFVEEVKYADPEDLPLDYIYGYWQLVFESFESKTDVSTIHFANGPEAILKKSEIKGLKYFFLYKVVPDLRKYGITTLECVPELPSQRRLIEKLGFEFQKGFKYILNI